MVGVHNMDVVKEYQKIHNDKYYKMIGRVVRSMEKEVSKLLKDHSQLGKGKAYDIVIAAYRQADNIVGGGYGR